MFASDPFTVYFFSILYVVSYHMTLNLPVKILHEHSYHMSIMTEQAICILQQVHIMYVVMYAIS